MDSNSNRGHDEFHMNWTGLAILIVGILFLLNSLDVIQFGDLISDWWPLILIVIGLINLKDGLKTQGVILAGLGSIFLLANLEVIHWGSVWDFWPLILIWMGISILRKTPRRLNQQAQPFKVSSSGYINAQAIFGGNQQRMNSANLKGGTVTAFCGGVELRFTDDKPEQASSQFSMTALFGGIEVVIPKTWDVNITGSPIMGGIEDKTAHPPVNEIEHTINISCTAAFGGIEVKN